MVDEHGDRVTAFSELAGWGVVWGWVLRVDTTFCRQDEGVGIEEKTEDSDSPRVLEGERACPPEDCGGPFGYKECMEGFAEWMDDDYDPEAFDPDSIQL